MLTTQLQYVHPSADCVVVGRPYQRADQGRWGDGESGDCDPYWSAEKGQVATTQSADGCTCNCDQKSLPYISIVLFRRTDQSIDEDC